MQAAKEWVRSSRSMSMDHTGLLHSALRGFCLTKRIGRRHSLLEAYAVYYAVCIKWRYYLALNKTVVHTDHRNLSYTVAQGHDRPQLCAYDLDITYVQGKPR